MLGAREPRVVLPLNGMWELSPGERNLPPHEWRYQVPVPALVDAARPSYDWKASQYHWYRTIFHAPLMPRQRTALLLLEQAMFGTDVWLNGERLGGNIACYTSQEYDLRPMLRGDGENELLVRVGTRDTLPPESAVGKDQERTSFIPGIWGDVFFIGTGQCRVSVVQVIPHLEARSAEVRVTVRNHGKTPARLRISAAVNEWRTHTLASRTAKVSRTVTPDGEAVAVFSLAIKELHLWDPSAPFLYEAVVTCEDKNGLVDCCSTRFGMREFTVRGGNFLLNGKRIFLRGGNIAFHRFLSSSDRGTLPWNEAWIKRALIDIPKAHNFNFFRNHLGQMYNRWYDIADEYGILLQNEWQFWTTTGTEAQIRKEFTGWLQDNWNHPSIVIWDPINESTDDTVQKKIVPAMKKLDPTRPWESVDFVEQHPYIYSLGPVLIDRKLGYSVSLRDLEKIRTPSMVNEFLWWWLDRDANPTQLTQEVVDRWLGLRHTKEDLLAHQAFLAQELVELFRRMRLDAIQPFVYISSNEGPTSHWFLGDIAHLRPKPVLEALRYAFAPIGVSLELWDRHFLPGEKRTVPLYIFNDTGRSASVAVDVGVRLDDGAWFSRQQVKATIKPASILTRPVPCRLPLGPGTYWLQAEIVDPSGVCTARSRKPIHVVMPPKAHERIQTARIALLDQDREHARFLSLNGYSVRDVRKDGIGGSALCILVGDALWGRTVTGMHEALGRWVGEGGTLLLIEPERTIEAKAVLRLFPGCEIDIERRTDVDRGGYDSHVHAENIAHRIWRGFSQEHLRFFNGGFGGEVVSQHNVTLQGEHTVLARCGLKLKVVAAAEKPYGRGRVILWRLQTRGRLLSKRTATGLYDRRRDPVAQQLFLNLVSYALDTQA